MLVPVAATVGGFIGLSLLAKSQTGQRLKFGLQSKLEINQHLDSVFIGNDKIQSAFRSNLNRKHGGVHVVYSPPSTGKTTYLTQEAQRQDKLKSHNIIYLSGGIKNRVDLHKALNIEPYWLRLSTVFLPVTLMGMSIGRAKTVLILDHQDREQDFDDDQKMLLMVLATDSMLFNNYHTIVLVSDLERAENMVKLNGGSKFYKLGNATMFKWQQEHIQEFVERSEVLMQLPVETREEIIKLGIEAGTCGFMNDMCAYFLHEGKGSTVVPNWSHCRAKELGKMWVEAARWGA